MNNDSESRVGLLVLGEEPNRSIHFGICLGIDPETEERLISTVAGAPERSYFTNADPGNPNEARRILIDVKQVMRESDRSFYVNQIETAFDKFWEDHGGKLCRKLLEDADVEELEEFFLDRFMDRPLASLTVEFVDFEELDFGGSDETLPESDDGPDESSEEDGLRRSNTRSTYPVRPVIDVREGQPVESLIPGTEISVKLTGDVAHRVREHVKGDPLAELPPLPAEVLSVDDESSSDNRTVIVKLQKNIFGIGKVTPGSRIEADRIPKTTPNSESEESIRTVVGLLLAWLALMAVFAYLVIL